jgi:hypothetical protein
MIEEKLTAEKSIGLPGAEAFDTSGQRGITP